MRGQPATEQLASSENAEKESDVRVATGVWQVQRGIGESASQPAEFSVMESGPHRERWPRCRFLTFSFAASCCFSKQAQRCQPAMTVIRERHVDTTKRHNASPRPTAPASVRMGSRRNAEGRQAFEES